MDRVSNPYTPGAGSRPPALTGRDEQLEAFRILLERLKRGRPEKSQIVTGLRGVGKTVLLSAFEDLAREAGFKAESTEITHDTIFGPMVARMMRRILLEMSLSQRMKDRLRRAAGILKAFTLQIPDGPEIGIDVEPLLGRADSGNLAEDLGDLFVAVGEAAAEHKTGVVLLLDEIQFLPKRELEALIAAIHQVSQRNLPLTVVGAGLPQIPTLAGEAKSYSERLFNFPTIDKLSPRAARSALEVPARKEGVEYESAATAAILSFTEGYPYYLQEYGKHVWDVASKSPITAKDARRARVLVQAQLDDNFFRVRTGRATKAERRYMAAMAALGKGPYRSGDVADRLNKPQTSVAPLRGNLIAKGLIYSVAYGNVDFTVPHFDDFVRRTFPALSKPPDDED